MDLICRKAKLRTHVPEQFDIPAPSLAKGEAFTEINLSRMQAVMNNISQEILCRLTRKLARKLYNDHLLDPENFEICEPLIERLQQRRSRLRVKYRPRMWVKRDRCRHGTNRRRTLDDLCHDRLMPEMQAIKDPERQHRRLRDIGIIKIVKDLHPKKWYSRRLPEATAGWRRVC